MAILASPSSLSLGVLLLLATNASCLRVLVPPAATRAPFTSSISFGNIGRQGQGAAFSSPRRKSAAMTRTNAPPMSLSSTTTSPAAVDVTVSRSIGVDDDTDTPPPPPPHPLDLDAPIVLVGFSGEGDELVRLAGSLADLGGGGTGGDREGSRSVVEVAAADGVLSPEDVDAMLSSSSKSKSKGSMSGDVLVLDFAKIAVSDGEGDESGSESSLRRLLATLEHLYEAKRCLVVYVNVHPEDGRLSPAAAGMKKAQARGVEKQIIGWSDYEVCIKDEGLQLESEPGGGDGWSGIVAELRRIVAHASLPPSPPGSASSRRLLGAPHTFFLSLSFPDVGDAEPYVATLCRDVDSMEFRVDLLDRSRRTDRHHVLHQLQTLRRMCRPHAVRAPSLPLGSQVIDDEMPVVYTVRTAHQAGTFPDDPQGIQSMFDLLDLGLRAGVEVLDVEAAWDPTRTDELLATAHSRYPSTHVLGSHHVVGQETSADEAVRLFENCALGGRAHGAKVVLSVRDEGRATVAHDAAVIASNKLAAEGKTVIPNIALVLGEEGAYSRIINLNFTPVTHECLPAVAAPGQLSASEIMKRRVELGILRPRRYAILGHNIAYSVSPAMQGGAFEATGLPHTYGRVDVETVEEFVNGELFNSDDFGGASVTIPHKQSIMPYVDVLTDAAREIGAVNTLTAVYRSADVFRGEGEMSRVIHGDNTDWIGMYNPLRRKLGCDESPTSSSHSGQTDHEEEEARPASLGYALILGGGGTARAAAYAARQLGLDRLYYNRTPSKARDLAESFGGTVLADLSEDGPGGLGQTLRARSGGDSDDDDDENGKFGRGLRVVISTLPAAAGFELPSWVLSDDGATSPGVNGKPEVVLDVNYKPYHTPLLLQCEEAGCATVRGSEMLWEQGVGQFERWTGRLAPYKVMKDVVLENCLPKDDVA